MVWNCAGVSAVVGWCDDNWIIVLKGEECLVAIELVFFLNFTSKSFFSLGIDTNIEEMKKIKLQKEENHQFMNMENQIFNG